jgi:two-component system, LytTR family, sensor kinase
VAPETGRRLSPFWRWVLIAIGVVLVFSFVTAAQHYLGWKSRDLKKVDMDFWGFLRSTLTQAGAWALLSPLIFLLAKHRGFSRQHWPRAALLHLLLSPVFSFLQLIAHIVIDVPVELILGQHFEPLEHLWAILPGYMVANAWSYWTLLGIAQAILYYRATKRRELSASFLEARLAEARLQVLKMQLQPHFLFNTLHAISALMHRDVDAADRMIARLSELLRMSLDTAGEQEVSLSRELDFLQPYLEIERKRFGDRLSVDMRIDPEALDARVPNLVLQPLVENAIRHGVAQRSASGRIEIQASRFNGSVTLRVADDGPGLPPGGAGSIKFGVGLRNTQQRLEQLYGGDHRFELTNAQGGGFQVLVTIPYRNGAQTRERDPNADR